MRAELEAMAREAAPVIERRGYMGVTVVGGYVWASWSQSREVFSNGPYWPGTQEQKDSALANFREAVESGRLL